MLKALVDKGKELEKEGLFTTTGYEVVSSEPVRYLIHLYPEDAKCRIEVEEYSGENRPRACLSTRTGLTAFAYPFADEAGYILGIQSKHDGSIDNQTHKKSQQYIKLLEEMANHYSFNEPLLLEAISSIRNVLMDGSLAENMKGKEVFNKTYLSFVYESGRLKNIQLHDLPETKKFWSDKTLEKVSSKSVCQCSACGDINVSLKNLPSSIKLKGSRRQLISLNKNAFVSYTCTDKGVPLGICPYCGDMFSKALNYLLGKNSVDIFIDVDSKGKRNNDTLNNQVAVYWLKNEITVSINTRECKLMDLMTAPIVSAPSTQVITTTELIDQFLKVPWNVKKSTMNIDENEFYLVILSPNGKGRIAVRDWFAQTAGQVKKSLMKYFEAARLIDCYGNAGRSYSIRELLQPFDDVDPNMAKALIRCAYRGENPPFALFQASIRHLRVSGTRNGSNNNSHHTRKSNLDINEIWMRLCTIIKLFLTYGTEEAFTMENLNRDSELSAYQTGRLLAVLEEIQRRAATGKLSATLVDRYYGSASTMPSMVFPSLISMATKAHMPKIRKNNRGYSEMETLLEEVICKIDDNGGLNRTLNMVQQGEFALGFYHQRANMK